MKAMDTENSTQLLQTCSSSKISHTTTLHMARRMKHWTSGWNNLSKPIFDGIMFSHLSAVSCHGQLFLFPTLHSKVFVKALRDGFVQNLKVHANSITNLSKIMISPNSWKCGAPYYNIITLQQQLIDKLPLNVAWHLSSVWVHTCTCLDSG